MDSFTYTIKHDPDCGSPRDPEFNDPCGIMHCAHSRYTLGDKGAATPFVDDNWRAGVHRPEVIVVLPIYMYDHSGITISHTPFDCKWDSGLLGWHYMTLEAAEAGHPSLKHDRNMLVEWAEKCLKAELEDYDHYLRGNCWWFGIYDAEGEIVESCGGFIGDDYDEMCMHHYAPEHEAGLRAAWEKRHES